MNGPVLTPDEMMDVPDAEKNGSGQISDAEYPGVVPITDDAEHVLGIVPALEEVVSP